MAFEQGSAFGHVDLYNKLFSFLTSHPDLVSAGQQWERVQSVGTPPPWTSGGPQTDVMLKGPGLAGQDEIFVSMRLVDDPVSLRSGMYIRGHAGVRTDQPSYGDHVNSSGEVGVPLWSQNLGLGYWFVANGRRFAGVIKAGTTYLSFYAGFILPYASESGYPYPLAVGGSLPSVDVLEYPPNSTSDMLGSFVKPYSPNTNAGSLLKVMTPAGTWKELGDNSSSTPTAGAVFPYQAAATPRALAVRLTSPPAPPGSGNVYRYLEMSMTQSMTRLLGGGYLLTPLTIAASNEHSTNKSRPAGVWGILDGVFFVPARGNAAENTVTAGGVQHLVVQRAFRSGPTDFFALALE